VLRQPKTVSNEEKHKYVEEVIEMLNMQDFADAIVGTPGEGLNVEQRKLLTIGVELAAKPALLIFLDEPTSGLDSQSSWSICAFLRKLADRGQAVLSTIHQPSAMLFQQFDRLLFLAKGGRTVYFGDIGQESRTLLDYFEANGARACGSSENVRPCLSFFFLTYTNSSSPRSIFSKSSARVLLGSPPRTGQLSGRRARKPEISRPKLTESTKNGAQLLLRTTTTRTKNMLCHSPASYGV
jgi:ABC-type multidrug transport system ATPase subunit